IIALMLGRLRMSINDAIDCYDRITKTVFKATQVGRDGKFKHKVLEKVIKDVVKNQVGTDEERMLDTRDNACKSFVCSRAAQDLSGGIPRLFRTYQSPEANMYNCMIWEAARATSAAPTFFERISIAGPGHPKQSYIDGGLGRNNPTKQIIEEARLIFPDRHVACVISIGTGKPSTISIPKPSFFQRILPGELIRATIAIATDCEAIEQEVAQRFRSVPDFYYRFNVEQGMQSIGLAEFDKMENVVAHTDQYIRGEEVKQRFTNVVLALCQRRALIPTPQMTIVSLIGLGGAGKTQVALEYCRRRKEIDHYRGIFWLDASSSKTIGNDMKNIARQLEPECVLENNEAAVDMVKSTLSDWTDSWLLVFDNLDNPSEVAAIPDFFPESKFGSILITSRYRGLQELGQHCLLQEMDEDDGLSLLLGQQYSEEDEVLGKKILELLGHLPLAIDQARAYISRRGLHPQDFITEFNTRKTELFKATPSIWQYKYKQSNAEKETVLNVATTWEMSLSLLETSVGQPSKDLQDILTLLAFFHPRAISEDIFSHSIGSHGTATSPMFVFNDNGKWNHLKFEDILTKMQELSLLQFSHHSNSQIIISIHLLVSEWLCMRLEIGLQKNFIQCAMLHLQGYLISLKDYDILSRSQGLSHTDKLSSHPPNLIDYFSDPFYDVAYTFGNFYWKVGQYEEAERMYEQALAGQEKALGPNHTKTLITVVALGLLYSNLGRLEEAERMYERALAGQEKALGSNHAYTLITVDNLGQLYSKLGRLEEAERMYERALAGKEKALGPNHTSTLITVGALGLLYRNLERLEEAERMHERALAGFEKALGPNHTETLITVGNLGQLYKNLGRLEEAERMYERALAGFEKALGPNHTFTLITVDNLGQLYSKLGQLEEAERMYERALAGSEKALGPNHTETLTTVDNLGQLYRKLGWLEEAERMYERALAGFEKALGPNHTETLITVNNLGQLYHDLGQLEEAERMYEWALAGFEKALGPNHTETLITVDNLGQLYSKLGQLEEAERMYERALAGKEKALGPNRTETLITVNNLGQLYNDLGRLEEAERIMYERALAGKEKALGPNHTSTLGTVSGLGQLYSNLGQHKEAKRMYDQALAGYEKVLGPNHTYTLITIDNLGQLYMNLGQLEEAKRMYEQALAGKEKALGPNHTETLITVNNLGQLYNDLGQLEEAKRMYERALAGKEKVLGPNHTETLITVNNLGHLYSNLGQLEEAERMYERALAGKEKALGPNHTETLITVDNLGQL
ncbi:hypothetical protein M422DRAFT_116234, partial [Sphaerobolus stellatus SS14]